MSQKRIKNHHYVPKVLQKAFRCEDDRIWYCERIQGRFNAPAQRNIETTFREKNLYTVVVNGVQSDIVERKFYGNLDNYLGIILPKILEPVQNGQAPQFSDGALDSVRLAVFELMKRTPHFTRAYDDISIGREVIEKEIEHYLKNDRDDPELIRARNDLLKLEVLKSVGRTVRVKAVTTEMHSAHEVLKDFQVRWAVSHGKASFILSDLISYRIGNGGSNGLANPNAEIWMPISPKVSLILVRDEHNKIPLISVETVEHIRAVNEYAVANSNRIGAHSERLLKSLIQ